MSVKNLITDVEQLRLAGGNVSKSELEEVPPDRTITGTGFAGGSIHFRYTVGGNRWWIPSKSFLSMRTTLTTDGTTQPTLTSDMAPSPGYSACLWNGVELRVSDKPISRITAELPLIDAAKTRLTKSKAWIDSVGKSTNYWEHSYVKRRHSIVSNHLSEDKEAKYVDLTGTSVAIAAADGAVTGVATLLSTETAVGDILVVNGVRYAVTVASADATGTNMIVEPAPNVNVAATTNFHKEVETWTTARQRHNVIETVWQPPLGIFDSSTPLPPGDYDLVLTPNTSNYNNAAIQVSTGTIGTKAITMQQMNFYVYTMDAENIPDDFTYYLDLTECSVERRLLTSASNAEQNLNFTVAPTTFALSYASQESTAGSNPIYPPTMFVSGDVQERNLKRLRLNYAAQTQPINETIDLSTNTDYMTKLYVDSLLNSNAYSDTHGAGENKDDWLSRGPLAHYTFRKPANDGSTRVNMQVTLNTASTTNALLFSWYKQIVQITYRNGRVETVDLHYG